MATSNFKSVVQLHDMHCPHLKVGEVAYRRDYCGDGLGNVEAWAGCEECVKAADERALEVPDFCSDCDGMFPTRELTEWKFWDDASTEEPLLLCPTCRSSAKHVERVRKDKLSMERELDEQEQWDE